MVISIPAASQLGLLHFLRKCAAHLWHSPSGLSQRACSCCARCCFANHSILLTVQALEHALSPHLQVVQARGPHTLRAGRDEGVVADHVGVAPLPPHLLQELQRQAPLPRLLACTDQAAVRDHAALAALQQVRAHVSSRSGLQQVKARIISWLLQIVHSSAARPSSPGDVHKHKLW